VNEPRRHHLVPVFYIKGFTRRNRASDLLHVFDNSTGKRYQTSPTKACRETDFFRLDDGVQDRQLMERILAEHERTIAPFTQQVATDRRMTDARQVGEVLSLAAVLAARSRRGRDRLEAMARPRIVKALREGIVTEADWERHRELELANGATESDVPPYAEAREKALAGGWMPRAPRALVVGAIPYAQDGLLKMLQRRHWEAHITDAAKNGGFICADSPLVWGDLDEWIAGHDASLDDPNVEITFPVSKDVALVSYPSARDGNLDATDDIVAHINTRTLHGSMGLVMHAHDEFLLMRKDGGVHSSDDYFAYQDDARRRGILKP
jgi:uncharacterized protein DUF4238